MSHREWWEVCVVCMNHPILSSSLSYKLRQAWLMWYVNLVLLMCVICHGDIFVLHIWWWTQSYCWIKLHVPHIYSSFQSIDMKCSWFFNILEFCLHSCCYIVQGSLNKHMWWLINHLTHTIHDRLKNCSCYFLLQQRLHSIFVPSFFTLTRDQYEY